MAQNTIKGFNVSGTPYYLDALTVKGRELQDQVLDTLSGNALKGLYVNTSNNLEINAGVAGGEKLNLVADDAIQIKPGDGEPLQLDCEKNLVDINEYGVKVCNGSMNKNTRVVGLKLNTAEITLDNQKANTNEFDLDEMQIKVRNDKWNGGECVGSTGPIYLKTKARAFDFRCHDHGGIALQIAGHDNAGNENKIKFESDRTTAIGATPSYCKEGGKGLEFGTFNNEHTSLYTGDYRFKGDANVFGVTRNTPVLDSKGKTDYPTQGDDFKDVIDASTPKATWNEIIDAAKKCKTLDETVRAEVTRQGLSGNVDASVFVTKSEVQDVVASAVTDLHIDTTGLATEQWVLDRHYIDAIPDGLQYVKIGSSKGNFAIDVTGKYTWEATNPKETVVADESGDMHAKGDRIINYTNEAFYTNANKVYYKAAIDTVLADGVTAAPEGTIVYNTACDIIASAVSSYTIVAMGSGETSFYEDSTKFVYKGTKNISIEYGQTTPIKKKATKDPSTLSEDELAYYEANAAVYNEDGNLVSGWEKVPVWTKNTAWSKNEINVNLETDSKIKFAGKKIETVWTVDDVDKKMDEILLSTETLAADATEIAFEKKISKNGDRSGQDTEIVYTYGNNVSDPEKTPDSGTFITNYISKHAGATSAEAEAKYAEFMAEGTSFEIRVKVSELLGLVQRVADLEARLAALEAAATPESEPEVEPEPHSEEPTE